MRLRVENNDTTQAPLVSDGLATIALRGMTTKRVRGVRLAGTALT